MGLGAGCARGRSALLLEAPLSLEGRSGAGGGRERFPRTPAPVMSPHQPLEEEGAPTTRAVKGRHPGLGVSVYFEETPYF